MASAAEIALDGEQVLAASMDPMAVIDGDRYVAVNRPYADLHGYGRPDDLAGELWERRLVEDDRERFETEILPKCRANGQWRGTVTGCRRDDSIFSQELSIAYFDDEHFICTTREIENNEPTERDVEDHRQLIEHVFDAVDDIVYVLDDDGDAVLWNAKLRERTGYTDAEIEAINPKELVSPEQHDYAPSLTEAIDQLGDQRVDLDLITKDGERIPHEFQGTTFEDPETGDVFRCGIAREITDRKEHEEQLRRQRTLIQAILNTIPDVVFAYDDAGNHIVEDALLDEFAGYPKEELAEMNLLDFLPKEDRAEARKHVQRALDDGETVTFETEIVTKTGQAIPHEYRAAPMEVDGEIRGVAASARDITDRLEREEKLLAARQFNEELVENAPFGMFRLDEDLRITYENPRAEEIIGLPDNEEASAAIGVDIRELPSIIETGQADLFTRLQDGKTIEFEFPFESIYGKEAYFTGRGVPLYRDGEFHGAVLMAIDISERIQNERNLERQRDELETLDRINELLLEIARDLFESPTRTEIEQTVCDRLAASDLYQFAWIGEPNIDGDRIVPRASAGIDDGYVETITVNTTETETGQGPGGRALRTGNVQVSQDIRSDPSFKPWREKALDRGIRSAAAVPLVHGDTTYGILAVYATRPLAFSHREQDGFKTLGEAVGFAINAIENRNLLFADAVVELEFEVTDSGLVFVRASEQLECELTITGYVESISGAWSVYLTVDGAAPTAVRDVATDDPDVNQARIIADEDDGGLLEFVMKGDSLNEITEHGAILTSGYVDDGRGRFCIEAPQTTDIHRLTTQLQTEYPDSTLVAQREFDRPVRKAGEIRQSIDDRLTDRQREALMRAYHAGYFDWPRQSTAGDIAASMDIAETTFHYHLRNALETLLAAFAGLEER